MVYLLAIGSAVLYGAADFTGGLTTRRASTIPVVLISQATGLALLTVILPVLPHASPARADLLWGAAAGLTGGIGVALLYHALAIGTMAVVAPTTAVCAVVIPVVVSVLLGERPVPLAVAGIALGIVSIVLVSQQQGGTQAQSAAPTSPRSRRSGLGTALASGIAIGFFLLSFAQTGSDAGMWPLLVARLVSVSLFAIMAIAGGRSIRMPAPGDRPRDPRRRDGHARECPVSARHAAGGAQHRGNVILALPRQHGVARTDRARRAPPTVADHRRRVCARCGRPDRERRPITVT